MEPRGGMRTAGLRSTPTVEQGGKSLELRKYSSSKIFIRQAKKAYWNSIIADLKSSSQAYRTLQWHNAAPRYQTPPLRREEGSETISDPYAMARFLHHSLLSRQDHLKDMPPDTPVLDAQKTELIYFHLLWKYIEFPMCFAQRTIRPKSELKWLSILFDSKLSFKEHVRVAFQRARVVTDHLAINRAARAALPVYKTFPIPALLRETRWRPENA
ncbi:hypothetical protein EPUL_003160 [Erysiphe pulchra]|uniref:Uncharacterized protein n=1 Tax=Erysiphe pulchra TaxID=225359 RepID=A0A2S4PUL7_9PEZI|nr:hypothetical protein EPUL_003160 [Erysiphe pulchra]